MFLIDVSGYAPSAAAIEAYRTQFAMNRWPPGSLERRGGWSSTDRIGTGRPRNRSPAPNPLGLTGLDYLAL